MHVANQTWVPALGTPACKAELLAKCRDGQKYWLPKVEQLTYKKPTRDISRKLLHKELLEAMDEYQASCYGGL